MELSDIEVRVLDIISYYCSIRGYATAEDIAANGALSARLIRRATTSLRMRGIISGVRRMRLVDDREPARVGDDAWLDEVSTSINRRGKRSRIDNPVVPRGDTMERGFWSSVQEDSE